MASKLKIWRITNDLLLDDIGRSLGYSGAAVRSWELNLGNLSLDAYLRWKAVYGFDPVDKFGLKLDRKAAEHFEFMKKLEEKPRIVPAEIFKISSQKIQKKNKELYESLAEKDKR